MITEEEALTALERLPLDGAAGRLRRFASEAVARALEDIRLRDALGPPDGEALELLRRSLGARAVRSAIDALRAAALLGERATVSAAIENLTVSDPAQRANAVEVIETVGEPAIVRPLLALLEPPQDRRARPSRTRSLPRHWLAGRGPDGEAIDGSRDGGPLAEQGGRAQRVDGTSHRARPQRAAQEFESLAVWRPRASRRRMSYARSRPPKRTDVAGRRRSREEVARGL